MATNYPSGLDAFSNPTATDSVAAISHADQHANVNDAVEALQAKVGVNSSAVTSSHDYKISQLESGKLDKNTAISAATKTKITYDADGLVTAGADATTADIADSTNKRYVTDAQLTVIGNTSGTNSGDNSPNSSALALDQSTPQTITGGQPIQNTLTASELVSTDANKKFQSLPVATYPSLTELSYVKGVTSAVQTQLGDKAPTASPTFSGEVTIPNTGLHLLDSNASHDLIIKPGSDLTADKTLTVTTGDADTNLNLTATTDEYVLAYDVTSNTWRGVAPAAGGSSFWTAVAGSPTRTGNTTFTVTGDYTALLTTGLVIKWTETSAVKVGMVLSSSYSNPNTTVTIIGDTMTSIDSSSCKYFSGEAVVKRFAVAGTLGATGTDIMNAWYADYAYRVIGARPFVGTAGTTNNTTFDINKAGTTMFTTKPTIATTATTGTIFTADSGTSLAINDKVTVDIDAVQTTAAIDGYVDLYLLPTRVLSLV